MKVFVFDLLPYREHLEHLKVGDRLPTPLEKRHFKPAEAVASYSEHLEAWVELERLGYDGVAFNEHHATPYGLMTSPNLMAAAAARLTSRLKLLIYGNLLPLHHPLRLAEELAMIDCLSNGRLIAGVARGAPREYAVYNIPMAESRPRFEEAYEIIHRAWTEESFSYEGRFHSFRNVGIWPRPVQQPHPPVWVPVTGSKESIEWAAARNIPITPGVGGPARDDIISHYTKCLAAAGYRITPSHLNISIDAYVADSKAQAVREYGPYVLYFHHTLFNHGNVAREEIEKGYYTNAAYQYLRPELQAQVASARWSREGMTMAEIERQAEAAPWGAPDEVAERIIAAAEAAGAETVQVSMNRGAMPQEMFLHQIRRFGTEVLPRLQAHAVTRVPVAEAMAG